ncbi:MAG: DNA polymerase III subunit gamma/tau [Candidatus Eremiobacteraeota bacterium]|nr:DNA polymerase III subunit gamma/tau [Candidatus Eremiobacteraeota bacterium]
MYRTWRPKTFNDLVGQDAVVRTLSSAIQSGKLAHAYMFSGPRGSGKTSAAKILARCINCVNGPTPSPDNTCENCVAMLTGTALDVLEIDAASNRGIDEIRALRDAVKFAPAAMRMKVYIIDEAHMLTKEGANAFLKTLEEPPAHAVFILATTEPEKLPPTILSRCQRYAFRRIAIPVMIERMREIAAAEGIAIDDGALSAIAYRADGGLRDALTMLEQAAAFADGAITPDTIELAFGTTGRNYAQALLDHIVARDAGAVLRTIDEASDAGTDMQVLIRSLIAEFRNLLVGRIAPGLLSRELSAEDAQRAAQRAKDSVQAHTIRALRLLTEALATARASGHPRLELESALLRLVLAGEDPSLDALNARLTALETNTTAPSPAAESAPSTRTTQPIARRPPPDKPSNIPAPEPAADRREPTATDSVSTQSERNRIQSERNRIHLTIQKVRAGWQNIRTRVESERQTLRMQLSRAMPESIDGNVLVVKLTEPWMVETLREHQPLLEKAVAEVLGEPLKIVLRADGAAPGGIGASRGKTTVSTPQPDEDPIDLLNYATERIG